MTALWALPAAFALLDWYAVARDDRRLERLAKPATLAALVLTAAVLGATGSTAGWWLLAAPVLGLVGDVMLLEKSDRRFQLGLAAFLVGHLAYVGCFATLGLPRPAWSWLVLVVLAGAVLATRAVVPAAHEQGGAALSVPVAVYTVVIGAMLVCAWFTGLVLVAVGSAVFVVSDTTLAIDKFVRPLPRAQPAIMTTYHVGQALIVLGVLAATT